MVTRRSYFSIVILMAVITFLFLLPKIFEEYSIKYHNSNIETVTRQSAESYLTEDKLKLAGDATADSTRLVYIYSDGADSEMTADLEEWCVYRKMFYRVLNTLETCENEIPRVIVVGNCTIDEHLCEVFRSYLKEGTNIIFTQAPDYETVQSNDNYRDLLGILKCKEESIDVEELHIFNNFLVSGERLYSNKDFYGDKGKFSMSIPYYELRAGYQVFAQGKVEGIEYLDYPPVIWRTYTENGLVFVMNTDLFEGKGMMGALTAFVSQCDTYDIYPVVNAQTVSVLNFPVMNNENEEMFEKTYDRDLYSFSRDILWPGISAILQSYDKSYNFFMAPKLDYSEDTVSENPDLEYYYSEVVAKLGTLGISYDQVTDEPLTRINEIYKTAIEEGPDNYKATTLYIPVDRIEESDEVVDEDTKMILTDMQSDRPIIQCREDGILCVSFTSSGILHNIREDMRLSGIETAIGVDMQSTNMMEVLFKSDDTFWEKISTKWASETTYLNDFRRFDTVAVEESVKRFADFMQLDYTNERTEEGIAVNITSDNQGGYFILRLWNEDITEVSGGSFKKINDTAYLINVTDKEAVIHTKVRK